MATKAQKNARKCKFILNDFSVRLFFICMLSKLIKYASSGFYEDLTEGFCCT